MSRNSAHIDALPVTSSFIGNDTSPDTLAENLASWCKGCHFKFNNKKISKANKRKEVASVEVTQRSGKRACLDKQICILCTEGDEIEQLHNFSTFNADAGVRAMVTDLQDSELLSRMATVDLIAIEPNKLVSSINATLSFITLKDVLKVVLSCSNSLNYMQCMSTTCRVWTFIKSSTIQDWKNNTWRDFQKHRSLTGETPS